MNPREEAAQINAIPNLQTGYAHVDIGVDWTSLPANKNSINVSLQIMDVSGDNGKSYNDLVIFTAYPLDYDSGGNYTQTFNLSCGSDLSAIPISTLTVTSNMLSFTIVVPQDVPTQATKMPFTTFLWGGYQGPTVNVTPPTPIKATNLFLQDFSDDVVTLNFYFDEQTPQVVPKTKNSIAWPWRDAGV